MAVEKPYYDGKSTNDNHVSMIREKEEVSVSNRARDLQPGQTENSTLTQTGVELIGLINGGGGRGGHPPGWRRR